MGYFLPFYSPITAQKIKISQKWKKTTGDVTILLMCNQKLWLDDVWFLRYGARQTDGQTNRQKKWHIGVSFPPKNLKTLVSSSYSK